MALSSRGGSGALRVIRLGLTYYRDALDFQHRLAAEVRAEEEPSTLVALQHHPVYTVGKRETVQNLKLPEKELVERTGAEVCHVRRGGDVTFHGPGQCVLYPIVRVRELGVGVRRFVEGLEDVMIRTCAEFGVEARGRVRGKTGAWVGDRKIGAVGVQISEGVSIHGLALNVCPDLKYFEHIVPCGLEGVEVTSLRNEGVDVADVGSVEESLIEEFISQFGFDNVQHSYLYSAPASA